MFDQIMSYLDMCQAEGSQQIQKGMNYAINPQYSVILMSQRSNAPYRDKILKDGKTIEYEGHDEPRHGKNNNPKELDQPKYTYKGGLTENGKFIKAVAQYRNGQCEPRLVKVYEKIIRGVWSLKGFFDLIDYRIANDGKRNVYIFILSLTSRQLETNNNVANYATSNQTRLIPSDVKKRVWERDKGKCVICGSALNLHFDHDLPYSKGGSSLTENNIRLLCASCNLKKSDKIE
ncbi:MAG: HNH endonuclease [Dehalococcoidia bacterium]|nr:HNH endonuclease [Dehalococcoidia bacterium]MDD5493329.1 HNH endonuclease [Dehalococcoidia bacterium]